jgi:hypothetical protein
MKKIAILVAASFMLSGGAIAAANPDSNGANKNCFGQGRSDYASTNKDVPHGQIISERAKTESTDGSANQNVQLNNEYKAACQAA